ncbi:MAG TPA: sigma-70 family RNA polymerase sigma factor [Opitutaceae bacterium]|nr:sigma-70 family RNA polymerase sigma factor [Opitutaceae bacterium]
MPAVVSIATPLNGIPAVPAAHPKDAPLPGVPGLTRQLALGDEAAFREFHAQYFDRLYHFLLAVTRGQEHAAQDALQETLLRVVRYAREFETEEAFWGWLQVVARNAARDGGRKHRRYAALLERFAFRAPVDSPWPGREQERVRDALDESLAAVDAADRSLIEGKYLHGSTVLELAQQTGLTEKAVESRLHRLRRQIAAAIMERLRAR